SPGIGIRATVRASRFSLRVVPPLEPVRLLARCLVVVHDSILDNEECLGLHTFVVIPDCRARAFLRAISLDVHELRAVLEFPKHLVGRRNEARSGVVGFITERTVELCWMTDRLVDREPEVRRMENQIVSANLD